MTKIELKYERMEYNLTHVPTDDIIKELQKRTGKGDILALKIWRKEDITNNPFCDKELNPKDVDYIALNGNFSGLEECTDQDWFVLNEEVVNYLQNKDKR